MNIKNEKSRERKKQTSETASFKTIICPYCGTEYYFNETLARLQSLLIDNQLDFAFRKARTTCEECGRRIEIAIPPLPLSGSDLIKES